MNYANDEFMLKYECHLREMIVLLKIIIDLSNKTVTLYLQVDTSIFMR
jgi:hypothetical protein